MKVWQKAIDLTVDLYRIIEKLPDTEKFGLCSQLRRCTVSISSCIAEGYGRYTDKEMVHYLRMARGSLYELITQLIICQRLKFIEEEDFQNLNQQAVEIDKMIISFINRLEKF